MSDTEATPDERALGISILRGMIALASLGGVFCIAFGARAVLGYPSVLPFVVVFPVFIGAFAIIGNCILVLHAQGVARGGACSGRTPIR